MPGVWPWAGTGGIRVRPGRTGRSCRRAVHRGRGVTFRWHLGHSARPQATQLYSVPGRPAKPWNSILGLGTWGSGWCRGWQQMSAGKTCPWEAPGDPGCVWGRRGFLVPLGCLRGPQQPYLLTSVNLLITNHSSLISCPSPDFYLSVSLVLII